MRLLLAAQLAVITLATMPDRARAAEATMTEEDPCDGLFAIMDRPTVADSACAVKRGKLLVELGYQDGPVKGSDTAHLSFFPQAAFRYGLPDGWEARVFPPNINLTTIRAEAGGGHVNGLGDTAIGAKKQIGTFGGVTVAVDGRVIVPTGDDVFGAGRVQGNLQAIASYNLTPKLGVTVELGGNSFTNRLDGGGVARFGNVNANLVFGYLVSDRLNLFSELFANTRTASNLRGNISYLGGVQLLLTPALEVDAEAAVLLSGPQGVQSRFFGVGTGLLF